MIFEKSVLSAFYEDCGFRIRKLLSGNWFPKPETEIFIKRTQNRLFKNQPTSRFFHNRCENTMILNIFPESDFLKKVAHVHSESFALVFNWG